MHFSKYCSNITSAFSNGTFFKLEMGCAGLCTIPHCFPPSLLRDSPLQLPASQRNIVLTLTMINNNKVPQNERLATGSSDNVVIYKFTALVHEIVPEEWMKQENTSTP
mmetsp:Transcript_4265/g.6509  ORF Transcript_4265/g.6509 Transcript_4265/m.6509 type:complete len:108 (+) Transcript_4265:336-659(+)